MMLTIAAAQPALLNSRGASLAAVLTPRMFACANNPLALSNRAVCCLPRHSSLQCSDCTKPELWQCDSTGITVLSAASNDCSVRTKPELPGDLGAEDVLFTAWCGRMIPKAFSSGLPPLVAEAKQSRDPGASAYMLTHSRLW